MDQGRSPERTITMPRRTAALHLRSPMVLHPFFASHADAVSYRTPGDRDRFGPAHRSPRLQSWRAGGRGSPVAATGRSRVLRRRGLHVSVGCGCGMAVISGVIAANCT